MNMATKTAELIRERIEAMPIGEPFTPAAFFECGTRASVDQTLSRLVKAESIEHVTRGVFARPEVSRFVGKVMPEPLKVAETVAKAMVTVSWHHISTSCWPPNSIRTHSVLQSATLASSCGDTTRPHRRHRETTSVTAS